MTEKSDRGSYGFVAAPRPSILVHGGAGAPAAWSDGCRAVVEAVHIDLAAGGEALDAAVKAVRMMEDDGRYNAGSGSVFRMDGETVEMDAAVMDSRGRMGCVAALREVKNPVRVAREVAETPHVLLAGPGAREFALRRGLGEVHVPSAHARERAARARAILVRGERTEWRPAWRSVDLRALWNFPKPYDEVVGGCDTVGAVVQDREGRFAVATSTGGATPMLCGRVGDSPLPGCGFWAGPAGAVTATGIGEEIIRALLARTVYDFLALGRTPLEAVRAGAALLPAEVSIGIIAIADGGLAWCANRDMALASRPSA